MRLTPGLKNVRVRSGGESLVPESEFNAALEERFRAGYEAGQKALGEQLVEQRAQLIEIQTGVLSSIEKALPGLVAECEKSLVLLAIEAARRVVNDTPVSSELIERTIRNALAHLRDTAEYEVVLHPEDLQILREVNSSELPRGESSKIKFTADDSISRGGCIVQSHLGAIDATRDKLFQKLETAVLC